ncbi:zinc finger BED domain-containing protein RICESLEEPER 2-like [Nicotiana tabacum]|uniref:Zinc finger BED domain-containing protein RICESLEEPER 2-like n=1 Tax=Nicotiana tabacum TaxID=4097 RepID=A0AC58SMH1_TOBAC
MASQNEENLPALSSNAISLDDESQRPLQHDEVELGKRRYSRAWKHFKPVKVNGVSYGLCKYCDRRYKNARNCGTKSMLDHIPKCPNRPRDVQNEGDTGGSYFDQDVSRKQLAHAIILHEYPLSIVDHVGFRNFVASLQPMFKMVSRNTIKNDIMKFFDNLKSQTSKLLEKVTSRIAITTDMWTSNSNKKGFMAITGHFIDDSWRLQSHILRFAYVPAPHDKDALCGALVNCLFDWNLERKISTITVDNSSTNNAMIKTLLDEKLNKKDLLLTDRVFHVRCAAHILNLIVQEGLKVIGDSISKVRDSVLYWIGSAGRIERFEEAARLVHCSCNKKLEYDCPTRWNSTYLMLRTAIEYKEVFRKLSLTDTNYQSYPAEEQRSNAEDVSDKLILFYRITEQFSGTQYPTSSQYFTKVCEIKLELEAWVKEFNPLISDMASAMLLKFKKYWDDVHILMGVAAIFDPRYKMRLVEFFLPLIYGEEASTKIQEVRSNCYDLFQDYKSKLSGPHDSLASSSSEVTSFIEGDQLSSFDRFVASSGATVETRSELDMYLEEGLLPRTPSFDNLSWWKTNGLKFPTLQKMARDLLAIPVSTVASESAFSTSGRLISPHRSRLHPTTLEALMCARTWLWNDLNGLSSTIDKVSCPTLLDEEEEPDSSSLSQHC